jgi:hypothetical protein
MPSQVIFYMPPCTLDSMPDSFRISHVCRLIACGSCPPHHVHDAPAHAAEVSSREGVQHSWHCTPSQVIITLILLPFSAVCVCCLPGAVRCATGNMPTAVRQVKQAGAGEQITLPACASTEGNQTAQLLVRTDPAAFGGLADNGHWQSRPLSLRPRV